MTLPLRNQTNAELGIAYGHWTEAPSIDAIVPRALEGDYVAGNIQVCSDVQTRRSSENSIDHFFDHPPCLSVLQVICSGCNAVKLTFSHEEAQILVGRIRQTADWTLNESQMLVARSFICHRPSAAACEAIEVST